MSKFTNRAARHTTYFYVKLDQTRPFWFPNDDTKWFMYELDEDDHYRYIARPIRQYINRNYRFVGFPKFDVYVTIDSNADFYAVFKSPVRRFSYFEKKALTFAAEHY